MRLRLLVFDFFVDFPPLLRGLFTPTILLCPRGGGATEALAAAVRKADDAAAARFMSVTGLYESRGGDLVLFF